MATDAHDDGDDVGSDRHPHARIAALEQALAEAQAARRDAEDELVRSRVLAHHESHHAKENMRAFGRSEGVVFIEPRKPEPCHTEEDVVRARRGVYGLLTRFCMRYRIDQFVSRPILHQWVHNGKLYREAIDHSSSRFELFFDLLFVGIVHQLSDAAAEQPTGRGLAKYVLTFCPSYSIWSDVRDIVNQFGQDNVAQRMYILWIMLLLVGYSNNASSIEIDGDDGGGSGAADSAIKWALVFVIVAKFSKVCLFTIFGFFLPYSWRALAVQNLNSALVALFFLIAIFLPLHGQIVLVTLAIVLEYANKALGAAVFVFGRHVHARRARSRAESRADSRAGSRSNTIIETAAEPKSSDESREGIISEPIESEDASAVEIVGNEKFREWIQDSKRTIHIPAINIEHHVDRLGAFVTIVLGEMVANIFFKNSIPSGLGREAGRSFLALMLAFNLNWLYFGAEACREFVHALRRHWFTSTIFTYVHLPLIMSLLLASSATNQLVVNADVSTGLKFFFGTGVGLALVCMGVIGLTHKSVDTRLGRRLSRGCILVTRMVAGVLLALLPFAHARMDSIKMLAIYVGVTGFLIAEELFARIERTAESKAPASHES